jgi:hypothetical protein
MGANTCKCEECDRGEEIAGGGPNNKTTYDEETVKTKSAMALPGFPAVAAKCSGADERPPEQTGDEPEVSATKFSPRDGVNSDSSDRKEVDEKDCVKDVNTNEGHIKTFVFDLEPKQSLGARFAEIRDPEPGGTLVLTSITEKSALLLTTNNTPGIRAGDVILKVAGESGGRARLLELLQQAKESGGRLEISVQTRPAVFEVELLRKDDEKMGIVVAVHDDVSDRVEIRQVSDDGAVPSWNEKNYKNQIVSGDWIWSVNGVAGAANEMISSMQDSWKKKQKFTIQIMSFPTEELRQLPVSR